MNPSKQNGRSGWLRNIFPKSWIPECSEVFFLHKSFPNKNKIIRATAFSTEPQILKVLSCTCRCTGQNCARKRRKRGGRTHLPSELFLKSSTKNNDDNTTHFHT